MLQAVTIDIVAKKLIGLGLTAVFARFVAINKQMPGVGSLPEGKFFVKPAFQAMLGAGNNSGLPPATLLCRIKSDCMKGFRMVCCCERLHPQSRPLRAVFVFLRELPCRMPSSILCLPVRCHCPDNLSPRATTFPSPWTSHPPMSSRFRRNCLSQPRPCLTRFRVKPRSGLALTESLPSQARRPPHWARGASLL